LTAANLRLRLMLHLRMAGECFCINFA